VRSLNRETSFRMEAKMKTYRMGSMVLTEEEARRCGVLPEQVRERNERHLRILRAHGQDDTEFGRHLRW